MGEICECTLSTNYVLKLKIQVSHESITKVPPDKRAGVAVSTSNKTDFKSKLS